jgi:hypothetical protein
MMRSLIHCPSTVRQHGALARGYRTKDWGSAGPRNAIVCEHLAKGVRRFDDAWRLVYEHSSGRPDHTQKESRNAYAIVVSYLE